MEGGGHSPPWKSSFSHFSPSILIFVVQTIYIRIRYVLASVFTQNKISRGALFQGGGDIPSILTKLHCFAYKSSTNAPIIHRSEGGGERKKQRERKRGGEEREKKRKRERWCWGGGGGGGEGPSLWRGL